ncbi:hypothetical protein V1525DRAFT_397686 [Lipomyces kononenkoae]|uniref:Uncharacterized protein n=1 Tax=Lipomyces kononenkoae TaxID=34357 RepID=A0ACC3T6Y1_LIPKO
MPLNSSNLEMNSTPFQRLLSSPYSASGPIRKRRRTNNDKLEKEEEKATLKGFMSQLARSRRSLLQQGIDLLEEEEYSGKLSSEQFEMMFTGIKDVARRDRRCSFKWYRTDRYGARTNSLFP